MRTGPYADNPMCPPPPEPCRCTVMSCRASGGTERRQLDGVTKALLIDYRARQLIHCTNLFQVGHPALLRPLSPTYLRNYYNHYGCPSCRPTNSVRALKAQSELHVRYSANFYARMHVSCVWGRRLRSVTALLVV